MRILIGKNLQYLYRNQYFFETRMLSLIYLDGIGTEISCQCRCASILGMKFFWSTFICESYASPTIALERRTNGWKRLWCNYIFQAIHPPELFVIFLWQFVLLLANLEYDSIVSHVRSEKGCSE